MVSVLQLKNYKKLYEECKALRRQGYSMRSISSQLSVSKSTVSRWLNEQSEPMIEINYDKNFLIELLNKSSTKVKLLNSLGLGHGGSQYRKLYRLYSDIDINIDDYFKKNNEDTIPNSEIFIVKSPWASDTKSTNLKNRVLKHNLLPYVCRVCDNKGQWGGKELVLQLHHINGINNDNRLANLEFLCPNCHTQTNNYAGKNK